MRIPDSCRTSREVEKCQTGTSNLRWAAVLARTLSRHAPFVDKKPKLSQLPAAI